MWTTWRAVAVATLCLVVALAHSKSLCDEADKDCQRKAISTHPVKTLAVWEAELSKPLRQRVGAASESLVEYITLSNQLGGFPERPQSANLDAGFLVDVDAALSELPPDVLRLLEKRLVGIKFVTDLGGTGYSSYVNDTNGKPVAALVTLDAGVLQRLKANQWATWKENTPFKPQQGYGLDAQIETDANNNRKNALQYILLHEFGHVISVDRDMHPNWGVALQRLPSGVKYPYFDTTWEIDATNNKFRSKFDAAFGQRKDVVYYLKPRLSGADMEPTYANLLHTSFSTLYAATNPFDDFAEAFVNYVHVVKLKRPWKITLSKDGSVIRTIDPCWDEARCAEKRALVEALLKP